MNSVEYLKKFGWKEGEALKEGGLKRPILVKHKYDYKGVGQDANDGVAWWERLFDGQLKALDVNGGGIDQVAAGKKNTGIPTMFNPNASKVKASGIDKSESPLYRMFVFGEILQGTIGNHAEPPKVKKNLTPQKNAKSDVSLVSSDDRLVIFDVSSDNDEEHKHEHGHRHKHKSGHKKSHKHRRNHNSDEDKDKIQSQSDEKPNSHSHKHNHKHKHKHENVKVTMEGKEAGVLIGGKNENKLVFPDIGGKMIDDSRHPNRHSHNAETHKKRKHSHKNKQSGDTGGHRSKKRKTE